jgi:hypothetical protein
VEQRSSQLASVHFESHNEQRLLLPHRTKHWQHALQHACDRSLHPYTL